MLHVIGLGAVAIVASVACTAGPGSTSQPTASRGADTRVTTTAPTSAADELDAMLPSVVLDHSLRRSSSAAALVGAEIAWTAADLLRSTNRTQRDIEVAERDNLSDGGSRVSLMAVRLPGVDADRLLRAYLDGYARDDFAKISDRQISGRAVSCTHRDGDPVWACWWPRDQVLFGASSDEFVLIREGISAIA
jgi:hypothetical protein